MKRYAKLLFLAAPLTLVLNRLVLRPLALDHDAHRLIIIVVNSLPNVLEAIMGVILLSGIGLELRGRIDGRLGAVKDETVFAAATLLAAVYTISQEVNVHSLGGNNVYDPYDLVACVFGLLLTNRIVTRFGLIPSEPSGQLDS